MWDSVQTLAHSDTEGFMPHGYCLLWRPALLYLHVFSDLLTAAAYYSIPLALAYFVYRRGDFLFRHVFLLFCFFILACGTTHLLSVWTIWKPIYEVQGIVKLFTALISVGTAVVLWPLLPRALALPSPAKLEEANRLLTHEIQERKAAEAEIRELNATLEERVDRRTRELLKINRKLALEIQERIRTEEALRKSEQRFRGLAEGMPHVVWECDGDGSCHYQNQWWFSYIGVEPGGTFGSNWIDYCHPDDREYLMGEWRKALASEGRHRYDAEVRIRRHDGVYRWFRVTGMPVRDARNAVINWVGTCTDVHDHKLAQDRLRETDRRKNEFIAMLGHELRNPLMPIRNAVQIMRKLDGTHSKVQWARDLIERQVDHLARLVDDLLDVSRIVQGKLVLRKTPLDLSTVIHQAIETSLPHIEARHHKLSVFLHDRPMHIDGDGVRLTQVISNLLDNAAKYTPEGGRIWLATTREDCEAVISVRDSGEGISSALLPQLFDVFTQADRTLDRSQGGLGLGLTIVSKIVEMHGGRVEAKSDGPGKGSEFVVRLPIRVFTGSASVVQAGLPESGAEDDGLPSTAMR
jgi:PAS domain S-box-containing protein